MSIEQEYIMMDGQDIIFYTQKKNSPFEGFEIVHKGGNFGEGKNSTNRIEGYWADLRRETNFDRSHHQTSLLEVTKKIILIIIYFLGTN